MTRSNRRTSLIAVLCVVVLLPITSRAAGADNASIETLVTPAIQPVMARYGVPGMAVGIVTKGRTYIYNYGVASTATGRPVTGNTLFEIGSVSKTFTATLAAYARIDGALSLSDMASKYLPSLRGSSFDKVSLLDLGTHMSGLPLQAPTASRTTCSSWHIFEAGRRTTLPGPTEPIPIWVSGCSE